MCITRKSIYVWSHQIWSCRLKSNKMRQLYLNALLIFVHSIHSRYYEMSLACPRNPYQQKDSFRRQTISAKEKKKTKAYANQYVMFRLLTRMFEGKYFLNRFALVTVHVVGDVTAVELRRSSLAVIYSAQIFVIFGEKFFLADVCLWK